MTRDEGTIFMVESNFQRSKILPSEKAFAYKMRLEAMKRQGQRTDLTSRPVGEKLSVERVSDESIDSARQIHRYIRLTELLPEILDMVDEGQIALRPAVELSYIPKLSQGLLWESMEMESCTPSHAQAIRMRRMSEEGKLTPEAMEAIWAKLQDQIKDIHSESIVPAARSMYLKVP
jgi:ParB family chromosome partitioning protein